MRTLPVALSKDHRTHKHFNRTNIGRQGTLSLSRRIDQSQGVAQVFLRGGTGKINLIAKDDKGYIGQLLDSQQAIQLGLGFGESRNVLCVD